MVFKILFMSLSSSKQYPSYPPQCLLLTASFYITMWALIPKSQIEEGELAPNLLPHRIVLHVVPDPTSEHRRGPKVGGHVGRLAALEHHRREH